jgi:hypothetical protein
MLTPTTFSTELARSFHRDIVNLNDFFYVFLGRPEAWEDEQTPPTLVETRTAMADVRRNIMAVKRITPLDAVLLIPRIDWTAGTVYDRYDDREPMAGKPYYILTDTYRVYKCLGNANASFSTVNPASEDPLLSPEPLTTVVEKFSTSDGYWWQFMFEVPVSDQVKFLTSQYIPVRFYSTSTSFDYNGIVDSITVTSSGNGYTVPPTVAILGDGYGATAEATINLSGEVTGVTVTNGGEGYTYAMVNFVSTGGSGATGMVNLIGSETVVAVNESVAAYAAATAGSIEFVDVLTAGEAYSPATTTIRVVGDGRDCVLSAVVSNGSLVGVTVISPGVGYTYADVIIESPTGFGATTRAIIGPAGGHGANLPQELLARSVGIVVTFQDDLPDLFLNNQFRQYGIIKNVRTIETDPRVFTEFTGRNTYLITVPDHTEYAPDDIVRSTSGGEFVVVSINSTNGQITLLPRINVLSALDTLENLRTAESGLPIVAVLDTPSFNPQTGSLILVNNIIPITRQNDQAETITIHIHF